MSTRRPAISRRVWRAACAGGRALAVPALAVRARLAPRREPLLDRVEPATDRAQLGLELAYVLVGGRPARVDRLGHGLAAAGDPLLGALAQVVHRLGQVVDRALGGVAAAAGRPERGLDRSLHRLAQRVGAAPSGSSVVSPWPLSLPGARLSCAPVPLEHHVRPIHLRPATELAERVLLPGDPHRALAVAQDLLEGPLMFNHARGLWGYTGLADDGEPLSIQSTGMGGPSAAIVCEELIALGARRLVRIGTCGALREDIELGALLAAREALPADGASAALGADGPVAASPALVERLVAAGATAGHGGDHRPLLRRTRREYGGLDRPGRRRRGDGDGHAPAAGRAARSGGGRGARRDRRARVRTGRAGRSRRSSRRSACAWAAPATRRSGLADGEALLRARHRRVVRVDRGAQGGDVAGDLVEPALDRRRAGRRIRRGACAPRGGPWRPRSPRDAARASATGASRARCRRPRAG